MSKKIIIDKTKLSPEDYKRYAPIAMTNPDPNFNEERNKAVIKKTIKDTDATYLRKKKEADEGLAERSDMLYRYIRHNAIGGKAGTPFEQYIGMRNYMALLGERKVHELQKLAANKFAWESVQRLKRQALEKASR